MGRKEDKQAWMGVGGHDSDTHTLRLLHAPKTGSIQAKANRLNVNTKQQNDKMKNIKI